MSYRPAILQTGDQGRMWPVHCRNVRQRAVWTDRRETAAKDQLGTRKTVWHLQVVKLLSTWRQQMTASLCFVKICGLLNRHQDRCVCLCKTDVKGSCAAKPECKNGNPVLWRQYCKNVLLLFAPVLKVIYFFILIVYVLYHDYLLVFIDTFLFQCKVYCIRVIFLYQKVFHTFMCSIDCTTVQYHYHWNW